MKLAQSIATLAIILFNLNVFGQEIKLGVNLSTNAFQRYTFEGSSYQPNGSYYTYYSTTPSSNLIVDQIKAFNSLSFGANARFSRKQLGIVFEPQLTIERNIFKFKVPYLSERALNRKALRLPINLTYHIIKNINSPYLIGGLMLVFENNFDYQKLSQGYLFGTETAYQTNPDFSTNHFQGVFYDNTLRYNYVLGLGKKKGKFDFSARYVSTLTPQKYQGKKWQIEFNIAYYFISNKDLTRKNYLYEE